MSGAVLISRQAQQLIHDKYLRGQREHGGDLFRKPVLGEAIEEMVDGLTYLLVEQRQKGRATLLLAEVLQGERLPPAQHDRILAAFNPRTFGNAEGE